MIMNLVATRLASMSTNMPEMQPMINMLNRTEIPSTSVQDGGRMRTHNRTQRSIRDRNNFTSRDKDVAGPSTYLYYAGPSTHRDEPAHPHFEMSPDIYKVTNLHICISMFLPFPITSHHLKVILPRTMLRTLLKRIFRTNQWVECVETGVHLDVGPPDISDVTDAFFKCFRYFVVVDIVYLISMYSYIYVIFI